jgi:[ribosomal protein S18]-alanine N-acetyltransferase
VLYRLYQSTDFAQLYAVEEFCFAPPFRFSRAYMRQLTQSPQAATWIAEDDAELLGFAIVEWGDDARNAYIQTVEVTPARRGQGMGGELLRHIEDSARAAGATSIWLHVDVENSVAIRLYESRGYARQGREEHYYARHRAAFIYAKQLAQPNPDSANATDPAGRAASRTKSSSQTGR